MPDFDSISALDALTERIDALLPQTQCTRCGYPACRPYAAAIARGETDINHCPPGGEAGIHALAALLGRAPLPLDPVNGVEKPREIAFIDEAVCIGCTKCIQACPVDAIVGASKLMHTIIADECTGCELCIPPCPVDCIVMLPVMMTMSESIESDMRTSRADRARLRFDARNIRLAKLSAQREAQLAGQKNAVAATAGQNLVAEAIARVRAKRKT